MKIFSKIYSNLFLCGIQISFESDVIPSAIDNWQRFFNNIPTGEFHKLPVAISKITFEETSETTNAGVIYNQVVNFVFTGSDASNATRLELFHKIKLIKLLQNKGLTILIGRNDYNQNTRPNIQISNNLKANTVSISVQSMFPSGITPNPDGLFAYTIPVEL